MVVFIASYSKTKGFLGNLYYHKVIIISVLGIRNLIFKAYCLENIDHSTLDLFHFFIAFLQTILNFFQVWGSIGYLSYFIVILFIDFINLHLTHFTFVIIVFLLIFQLYICELLFFVLLRSLNFLLFLFFRQL